MRVFLLSLILCLSMATIANAAEPSTQPTGPALLRVMSFNIRNSGEHDLLNAWMFRRALFLQTIADFHPDLLGLQEVLADQHDDLTKALVGYTFAGVARDDGQRKGEWALIAFRSDRFEQKDAGNFWLSEQTDQPGSRSWGAACTRICSWVRLRDKLTGRGLLYANTHWDHRSQLARENAAKLCLKKLPELAPGDAILLTGDLNSTEDDASYKTLVHPAETGQLQLADSYRELHPTRAADEATYHGFTGQTDGSRIDFILHGPQFKSVAADINHQKGERGRCPSDHFAVTAVLQWQ